MAEAFDLTVDINGEPEKMTAILIDPELHELLFNIREYPGYNGPYSKDEFPGALPNGTKIAKIDFEEGDTHLIGATGVVLGSIGHPDVGIGYFVEWDDRPKYAVFVIGTKIGPSS